MLLGKMLRSSMPEFAVEKSGLPKSNVSIKEFGVDDDGKGIYDEAGLFCMVYKIDTGGGLDAVGPLE